jgi:S1-C subfamily serine protease
MRTIDISRSDRPYPERRSNLFAFAALALVFAFVSWRVVGARLPGAHASGDDANAAALAFEEQGNSAGAAWSSGVGAERDEARAEPSEKLDPSAGVTGAELTGAERATIDVFRRASPGVVHVTNVARVATRRSFEDTVQGSGSGFVWDREGHVVTNYHVVRGSDSVYVRFAGDDHPYRARIVNAAPHQDLAVLKLTEEPKTPLVPIAIGSSSDLLVGQHVYAIGNPFGLDQTLSSGLISGLGREIRSLTDHKIAGVIQSDAAINPGNSGGPLLDSRGRVIGVNTAIVTLSGAYNGIGFAVPVDTVKRVVGEIVATGKFTRPGLGVVLMSEQEAARLRLRGVGIAMVTDDSAAEKAGLRSASKSSNGALAIDEIVGLDGLVIRSPRDLYDALDGRSVGDTVTVKVRRGERVFDAPLRLQALRE